MTNEVASITGEIKHNLDVQLAGGSELWNKVVTWITQHGIEFAVNLITALLIFFVGMLIIKGIVCGVRKGLKKSHKLDDLLLDFICNAISKTCWAVLIVLVLGMLGIKVGPLIAGLGVTGFILGFAFQESLGSFAAGIMLALNRPFKVGDYVIAGGAEGTVLELNMMATVFATADNKRVMVPNKVVWGSSITNFNALGIRRVDTVVGVAYGMDVAKAIAVALQAVKGVPGVLSDPSPVVAVASLADSAVVLNVRPWVKCADYWAVFSAVQEAVKLAFEKNDIEIPFPHLVITPAK